MADRDVIVSHRAFVPPTSDDRPDSARLLSFRAVTTFERHTT